MPSSEQLLLGREGGPPAVDRLRAGPVTVELEDGDLRACRLEEEGAPVEIARRIGVAVRDPHWATIPPRRDHQAVERGTDHFRVTFSARHEDGTIHFDWTARIEGDPDGTIRYAMDGVARTDFPYARIGLAVLHPPSWAGARLDLRTDDGRRTERLPELIGPQWLRDGRLHGLFQPFTALTAHLDGGVRVRHTFTGERFELEDQRNWTDGSFKSYSTPLALGGPHQARAGQRFIQTVELTPVRARRARTSSASSTARATRLEVGDPVRAGLPPLGAGLPTGPPPAGHVLAYLAAIGLDHVRVDLRLGDHLEPGTLGAAAAVADRLGAGLEVALTVPDSASLAEVSGLLDGRTVRRVIALPAQAACADAHLVEHVRRALPTPVPVFGGTDGYFAELNRTRPDAGAMDGLAYSVNPQVHAGDERTLMENLQAQADTVATTRAFAGDVPVAVSPVTLRPRRNPFGGMDPHTPGGLPASVDSRQGSLCAAAWTLGSVKYLVEGDAAALTYYELWGWSGLVGTGRPFPLSFVLADLASWRGAEVLACSSSEPLAVVALALRDGGRGRLLAANLTPVPQPAVFHGLAWHQARLHRLHAGAGAALDDPDRFRKEAGSPAPVTGGRLEVRLAPYEYLRVDAGTR